MVRGLLSFPPFMAPYKLLSFLFLLIAVVACAPKEDSSVQRDPLETGYRLIDKGQYTDAISHLEDLSRQDPRPEVKEALASAYAARAGLQIETYWSFIVGFQAPLLSLDRVNSRLPSLKVNAILGQLDGKVPGSRSSGLAELARVISTLDLWQEKIDRIPSLKGTAREDAERALAVLQDTPRAGGRLYRALLGLVAFKSDLSVGFEAWNKIEAHLQALDLSRPDSPQNRAVLCRIDVRTFTQWATGLIGRLGSTGEDIAVAFPSKRHDVESAVGQSSAVMKTLQGWTRGKECR